MTNLSAEDRDELEALAWMNDTFKGPSFQWRGNWRNGYASLVRRGLVTWGDPPRGFDKRRFAGAAVTAKGRAAIAAS